MLKIEAVSIVEEVPGEIVSVEAVAPVLIIFASRISSPLTSGWGFVGEVCLACLAGGVICVFLSAAGGDIWVFLVSMT